MDKQTRLARRALKAQRTKRGELSPFAARGLGRKGKPAEVFPLTQCKAKDGPVKTIPIRKKRTDGSTYVLMIEKGGTRCPNLARDGGRCPKHGG